LELLDITDRKFAEEGDTIDSNILMKNSCFYGHFYGHWIYLFYFC